MPANRTYKDTVFSKFLSDPKRLVDVYNAIEGTNYPLDTPVEINTLEDVLYKERINDLSFTLKDQVLVLIEHQSTINENMAIRLLMYVGRLYEKLVKNEVIYREKQVTVPMPKFVVLYNGKEDIPEHTVQKLSDSYKIKQENVSLVNYEKSPELLQQSKSLREYSMFIYRVKENLRYGLNLDGAISEAIEYCVKHDIMKDFLERNGSEVHNMLYTEWDWDKAITIAKEEAYMDGVNSGIARGIEKGRIKAKEEAQKERNRTILSLKDVLSPETIAEKFNLSLDYVQTILASEQE